MKRIRRVIGAVFLLLLLTVGALAWWQRDNLRALYRAKTEDAETILRESEERRDTYQKELEQYDVVLRAPTQEEKDRLLNGESLSSAKSEEPAEPIRSEPTEPDTKDTSEPVPAEPGDDPAEPDGTKKNTAAEKAILERCIDELYDCEVEIMVRLGVMKQEALVEWNGGLGANATKSEMIEFGYRGLESCYDLEVEADAQVQGILARYRAELGAIGGDTAPLDTLWVYYCDEKASSKAYYLNKYL